MNEQKNFLSESFEFLQRTIRNAGPAASASYTMIGAILLLGACGYTLDKWLNTQPWLLLGGLILGVIVGLYELAKVVWKD